MRVVKEQVRAGRRRRYTMAVDRLASDETGTVIEFLVEEVRPTIGDRLRTLRRWLRGEK